MVRGLREKIKLGLITTRLLTVRHMGLFAKHKTIKMSFEKVYKQKRWYFCMIKISKQRSSK